MTLVSSRSFSLLSLNFPVRASYLSQVFNSITKQFDVYIYELLSTLLHQGSVRSVGAISWYSYVLS